MSEIANNQNLTAQAFKVARGNVLYKDVIAEMLLYLLEMDDTKLLTLWTNNELVSYCYKIIWLSYNSKTSPFYKKYLKMSEYIEVDEDNHFDISPKLIEDILNDIEREREKYPADVKIFRLYLKLGSCRKVEQEINVPHTTVNYIVNRLTKEIEDKI